MKKERIRYFDVIKLIAVVFVFTVHFTRSLEYWGISYPIKLLPDKPYSLYLGDVGVTLFFIISGAVLMYQYDESLDIKKYYKKRFVGIYPMFWIAFVVLFCVRYYVYLGYDHSIPGWKIIYSVLGIDGPMMSISPNFFSAGEWFLGVIITLYIIFPLLRKLVIKYSWKLLIIMPVIGICVDLVWTSSFPVGSFFLVRIPEFVFGMIFVKYIKRSNIYISVAATYILILFSLYDFSSVGQMAKIYIVGSALFLVAVWLFQDIQSMIVSEISRFVSKYCYPVFLIHHQIQLLFLKHFRGSSLTKVDVIILWVMTVALTFLFAYALDRFTTVLLNLIRRSRIHE